MNKGMAPEELTRLFRIKTGKQLDVLHYNDIISESKSVGDLFEDRDYMVLYYPQAKLPGGPGFGHFVALLKRTQHGKTKISYYDPLAYKIDEYKKFSPQRDELYDEHYNSLVWWLLQYRKEGALIEDNTHQHQSRDGKIATCGRHCLVRLLFSFLDNENYHQFVSSKRGGKRFADEFVYKQTMKWAS